MIKPLSFFFFFGNKKGNLGLAGVHSDRSFKQYQKERLRSGALPFFIVFEIDPENSSSFGCTIFMDRKERNKQKTLSLEGQGHFCNQQ